MTKVYLYNEKTGRKYEILRVLKKSNELVLRGEHAEITEPNDKDRFKRLGYVLQQEKEDVS